MNINQIIHQVYETFGLDDNKQVNGEFPQKYLISQHSDLLSFTVGVLVGAQVSKESIIDLLEKKQ